MHSLLVQVWTPAPPGIIGNDTAIISIPNAVADKIICDVSSD